MSRYCRITVLALALALALAVPTNALAASSVAEYQLQYAPAGEDEAAFLIVNAVVDPSTTLPATVTIPIPAGATVLWAGEVLGGDVSADPVRETTMERVGDMDVYTLTLEQAWVAQIECQVPRSGVTGKKVDARLTWTNPGDEVLVSAAVVTEAGATGVKVSPASGAAVQTNQAGETLHTLQGARIASGKAYTISATWTRPGASTSGSSPVLPVLLGALVVAVLALVAALLTERSRNKRLADSERLDE